MIDRYKYFILFDISSNWLSKFDFKLNINIIDGSSTRSENPIYENWQQC